MKQMSKSLDNKVAFLKVGNLMTFSMEFDTLVNGMSYTMSPFSITFDAEWWTEEEAWIRVGNIIDELEGCEHAAVDIVTFPQGD